MSGIRAKQIVGYTVLPGIIPRARRLFGSGFAYIALLLAMVYQAVRLLPRHHPYTLHDNIGKFGILHVIGEAANNLKFTKKTIDQAVVFALTLAGMVILILQFVLIIYSFIIQPATANPQTPNDFTSLFHTAEPTYDVAFMMLDSVFGVPDMFGSCVSQGISCDPDGGSNAASPITYPTAFQRALHHLFAFYSTGLLIVGVIIFLYFLLAIVLETATTGSPFGQRFQNAWVPIRLVVALGLLVPLPLSTSSGTYNAYNAGQYIALYAAKAGSGFATNGWLIFNEAISNTPVFRAGDKAGPANPLGEKNLLALPQAPDVSSLVQSMSLTHGCAYAHWLEVSHSVAGPWVQGGLPLPPSDMFYIRPYLVKNPIPGLGDQRNRLDLKPDTSYEEAYKFFNRGSITITFGRHMADSSQKGDVEPLCGKIRIPISDWSMLGQGNTLGGWDAVTNFYFDLVKFMWFGDGGDAALNKELITMSRDIIALNSNQSEWRKCGANHNEDCTDYQRPGIEMRADIVNRYASMLKTAIVSAQVKFNQDASAFIAMDETMRLRGWGGAGIYYNTLARINGAFLEAVANVPTYTMPQIMLEIKKENLKANSEVSGPDMYKPQMALASGWEMDFTMGWVTKEPAKAMGEGLYHLYEYLNREGQGTGKEDKELTSNVFIDAVNIIFGTQGLFNMLGPNAHIHPLSQLSMLGKGLVESSIRNVMGATASAALGGMMGALSTGLGAGLNIASELLISTAFIGLTAGFVLYYVLPFLPFIYFFFAVGSWVKGLFEAMVGVPLWALAHLRLDGEGLPGDTAADGYFLILEIFMRPIMTVLGLVAAIIIFTAQVRLLNFTWEIVLDNLTGFDTSTTLQLVGSPEEGTTMTVTLRRATFDQLFFTVTYAIIVYMMATASFKLIDSIPDNILRWGGIGVSSFGDINQDPTEGLTRYAAIGGMTIGQQAVQGVKQSAGQIGGALGQELKGLSNTGGDGSGGGGGKK